MDELLPDPEAPGDRTSPEPQGAPRWVRVFGVLALVFGAAFIAMHVLGGGHRHHGPFIGGAPPMPSGHGDPAPSPGPRRP